MILSDEVRQMAAESIGGNYYVLPSSTHEVLLVPEGMSNDDPAETVQNLNEMIRSVNEMEVPPHERLGDSCLFYDTMSHELMPGEEYAARMEKSESRVFFTGVSVSTEEEAAKVVGVSV